jgi:glycosyltransferase involved in cell wall biosynthesis
LEFLRKAIGRLAEIFQGFSDTYSRENPTVKSGIPFTFLHWLFIGSFKGKRFFPKLKLTAGSGFIGLRVAQKINTTQDIQLDEDEITSNDATQEQGLKTPEEVILQIEEMAKLEPMLFAPGRKTLRKLPVIKTIDTLATTGVDITEIEKVCPAPETLVLVPHFVIGGADHYTANLVSLINKETGGPVLVVATSPEAVFEEENLSLEMVQAYSTVKIALWKNIATNGCGNPRTLALFINAVSPKRLVIVQSDLAFSALERHGRSLSSRMKIYCAYFSMDNSLFSYQYGIRYFRTVADYSASFTDNETTLQTLKRLNPFAKLREIPTIIDVGIEENPSTKIWKQRKQATQPRYIWLSRLEEEKGTGLLSQLSDLLPEAVFDLFGPMQEKSLAELGLEKQNVKYLGVIPSVSELNLSDYDAFIFTSLSEGNPVVVLEMAALGIPIISTKVGSLDKVFSDNEIDFVDCSSTTAEMANAFLQKLNTLRNLSKTTVSERVSKTRGIVLAKHSEPVIREIVGDFFEIKN